MVAAIDLRSNTTHDWIWFVSFWGFNGPLRHISVYIEPSLKEGERKEKKIDELKNVQTIPTCTYCKRNRPLPYYYPN